MSTELSRTPEFPPFPRDNKKSKFVPPKTNSPLFHVKPCNVSSFNLPILLPLYF